MTSENEDISKRSGRPRGRPFAKGNGGRRPGSRNRSTLVAEALLRDEEAELVRKGIELATELADNDISITAANESAVRRALEAGGVEFIDENGGGPNVRFRERQRSKLRGPIGDQTD
jgi:hypothetical protein